MNVLFFIFQKTFKTIDLFLDTSFMTNITDQARFDFFFDSQKYQVLKILKNGGDTHWRISGRPGTVSVT